MKHITLYVNLKFLSETLHLWVYGSNYLSIKNENIFQNNAKHFFKKAALVTVINLKTKWSIN